MGLSLSSIGKKIAGFGKNVYEAVTPQNEAALRQAQANLARANQQIQAGQGFKYGPLVNPANRQTFVQNNQVTPFSLPRAAATTISDAFTKLDGPRVNVGDFFGSGFIENYLNSPFKIGGGITQINNGQYKQGVGNVLTGAIEGPLGFVPVGKTAQAGLKAIGLGNRIIQGSKVGMKQSAVFGTAYGAGDAMSQNASWQDVGKSAAISGLLAAGGGALSGGGLPIVGAGIRQAVKIPPKIRAYDAAQNQIGGKRIKVNQEIIADNKPAYLRNKLKAQKKVMSPAEVTFRASYAADRGLKNTALARQTTPSLEREITNKFINTNLTTKADYVKRLTQLSKDYDKEIATTTKLPKIKRDYLANKIDEKYNGHITQLENDFNESKSILPLLKNPAEVTSPSKVPTETPKPVVAQSTGRSIDDQLEEAILGERGKPTYKVRPLGVLAEKLSLNRQARKLTKPIEAGVDKVIKTSLESGSRVARTPGRLMVGISKQAGKSPEELQQLGVYGGQKELGNIYAKSVSKTGEQAIKQGVRPEAVASALDPELAVAKGTKPYILTPAESGEVARLRKIIDITHEGNYKLGLLDETKYKVNKGTYFPRDMTKFFEDDPMRQISKNNKMELNIFKPRKDLSDISKEVIDAASSDPYFLTAMRVQQYQRNKAFTQYSDWFSKNGSISPSPRKGYVEIPDNKAYGSLAGKHILKEQAEDLQGFIYETGAAQDMMSLLNRYDRIGLRRGRKAILTIFNPGVRLGNRTFNNLIAGLNGINPITFNRNWFRGRNMMKSNSPEFLEATKAGIFSPSMIQKELYRTGDITPKKNIVSKGIKGIGDTYQAVDDRAKMATYLTFRERGLSVAEAASRTQRIQQNYDLVGFMFDQGAKTPLVGNAFIRFSSELLRIAHNTAADNPIRLATAAVAATTLVTAASKMSGETPEDRKTREGRLGAPRVPFTNQSLELKTPWGAINAGRLLGLTTYNDLTGGLQEDVKRYLPWQIPVKKDETGFHLNPQAISADPLLGPFASQIVNRDFRDKPITDPDATKYPSQPLSQSDQNKNRLNALRMSLVPFATDANSIKAAAQGKDNYYGQERSLPQSLLRVGGIKVEQYGPEKAEKQKGTDTYFSDKKIITALANKLPSQEEKNIFLKYATNEKLRGEDKPGGTHEPLIKKGIHDTAIMAEEMLKHPKVFEVMKLKAQQDAKRNGTPVDPVYDLPLDRREAYYQIQIANNTSPGSPESKKLKQDQKDWYFDFSTQRSDYFDAVSKHIEELKAKGIEMYSPPQTIDYPEVGTDLQKKLDQLETVTDGAERGQFYKDNPDVIEFYQKHEKYIRAMRAERNLPQFDSYPTVTPELQKLMDTYSDLPKNDGPKGGNKTRSLWIQSHPSEWQALTDQWSKQAQYNLQNDAARAIYEGEDLSEKGIKSIVSLAKSLGMSTGGGGGFTPFQFKENDPTANIYKYAVDPTNPTPLKVSLRKPSITLKKGVKVTSSKVKVSMKKSRV